MKYWRGYLAAAIFAAITWAFVSFAKAHPVLIDMVYPYLSRLFTSSMAQWSGGTAACIWQVLLILGIGAVLASVVLMIVLKWNPAQWLGWVLAAAFCVNMFTTVAYSLNAYASPLADDIRLDISDYTVSELNDATVYFRDKANELGKKINRNGDGTPNMGTFEEMAAVAHKGFDVLTYDKAISAFASKPAPVKKLTMAGLFTSKGDTGVTVTLTGESAVNPRVPAGAMPFAMCKELSHRISIYSEPDANFAGFLACINHPEEKFQYSGYLMAYYYCYEALASIPTSTAQDCASKSRNGLEAVVQKDFDTVLKFYGEAKSTANVQATAEITIPETSTSLISFSSYTDVADLFASWYIQESIVPLRKEENPVVEFDPYDENFVFPTEPAPPATTEPPATTAPAAS